MKMRRLLSAVFVVAMLLLVAGTALADKPVNLDDKGNATAWENNNAFDEYGYNYQAHLFSGLYWNYLRPDSPYDAENAPSDTYLIMKWNDAWLSNEDRDGDGELDRHYGYESYIGSGAWCTNKMKGTYVDEDGKTCKWNYFVKIVAVPEDAYTEDGLWYTADGTEIGPSIWGQFAEIQSLYNDPCEGYGGVEYVSPANAGLGGW